jgi:superfamily II DNA or RNA helicase
MSPEPLRPGVQEALVTERLARALEELAAVGLIADTKALADAEASDRVSRHVGRLLAQAIETTPESERAAEASRLARHVLGALSDLVPSAGLQEDMLREPATVLHALLRRLPDGSAERIERPLTPLLDTTVLTNAPGEPAVGHELRAEVHSADAIDTVMAFIRWSGVRPLMDVLRRHCDDGKPLRVLTTTYTDSTEQRALDELAALGAMIRVSYDTTMTRLHAKAWLFHRAEGYSTAYVGSSNLTHSAQVSGIEWNVRLSGVRNPDAVSKIAAVFASYWASHDFVAYDADEFRRRRRTPERSDAFELSPVEIEPRPFQERLLEQLAVSRSQGHHRNLLLAATGTGKTVMAAVDYARLRLSLPRARLLFVAHRAEILDQSRATFRHALRDPSFGEKWVGGVRPVQFQHVFAAIQSLTAAGVTALEPRRFDVVIVDEFHHAAAPSYEALLERLEPVELLGLTATPERADGLDVLRYFDGRIAADLRIWDAIDQQYLAPFAYYGVHDGLDLRNVPWRRGTGYDIEELTNLLTADHIWARRVIEQVLRKIADPRSMRALGFCVSVKHARFMAARFNEAGIAAVAVWGDSPPEERLAALRDLAAGGVQIVFTVDLFNEGVDVPNVDSLLLLRPTDSPTLFLQQLGRGLRRTHGKTVCTVLDFVGTHRKEFRFDRRFRALLGGSRSDIERQVRQGFPFLPAGCHFELDPVAQEVVLRSIRTAIPTGWRDRCSELKAVGDVNLATFLDETGLELADVYAGNHSWSELRRVAGLPVAPPGPSEDSLLRAVGRLLHVDDNERIDAYRSILANESPPRLEDYEDRDRRRLRMLVSSLTTRGPSHAIQDAVDELWAHPQVRAELIEILGLLRGGAEHLHVPLELDNDVPLHVHARYTRTEILAAFGVGTGARPHTWQTGVLWDEKARADLFAFTLDKSVGAFSPTTRYRDYAISPELIHWESQSATSVASTAGQRYINHLERQTHIVLFARLRADERAFWCLGSASYVSHEGDRPIAFTWRLKHRLPADLYSAFAAAVA